MGIWSDLVEGNYLKVWRMGLERREEKWDRIGGGKKNHALLRPVNLDFMDNLPVINSVTQGKT